MIFVAGKISTHILSCNWRFITSDEKILKYLKEYSIEFIETPFQLSIPKQIKCNDLEFEIVDKEINESLVKGVIEFVTEQNEDDFFSNIFIRPNNNGKCLVILNL